MEMKYSNDKSVVFNSEDHTYFKKDKKLTSVTNFISKFKNEFDSDYWSKKIALRNNKTQENVLKEWKDKSNKSCEIGTAIHKIFEDYANNKYSIINDQLQFDFLDLPIDYKIEFLEKSKIAIKFINDFFLTNRLIPIHTEFIVYDDFLAGQIDMICKDKKDNYYIIDFKTNEKIEINSYGKKLKGIFIDVDDSSFYHYSLQLSIYKKMFKKEIKEIYLIHITNKNYKIIQCIDIFKNYNIEYKNIFNNNKI